MKKKSLLVNYKNSSLILLNFLVIGCTTMNTNNVVPLTPPGTPISSPVPVKTAVPGNNQTISVTPVPVKVTSTPSPSSLPVPVNNIIENTGRLKIDSGFIKTPKNAFLVINPFELKMKLSLDKLPEEKKIISIFELFDADASPRRTHFSLKLDHDNNFLVKAVNSTEEVNLNIPFKEISTGKEYEITFKRDSQKIEFFINNNLLFSRDFKDNDFDDQSGRRELNIGADLNGENRFSATVNSVSVTKVLNYDFKNSFIDSGKYFLDAIVGAGDYKFLGNTPAPTSTPTPNSIVTPSPSPTSSIVRTVKDRTDKLSLNLNVYNPKDSGQFDACIARKKVENISHLGENAIRIECLNGYGQYTSQGLDFGTGNLLPSEPGDMRFITYTDQVGNQLIITGNSSQPQVLILDIGQKIYDGIDASYLSEKVDYTNAKKIFSSSNASSNVIVDHVYAIRTYRYGSKPLYAKMVINNIITDDYKFVRFESPKILSQPHYVPSIESTRLSPVLPYTYYISVFDGTGETIPSQLNDLAFNTNAGRNKINFSFELPYNSRGYTIYRKDPTQIVQIGPIAAKAESMINFEDTGNKGNIIDQIPNQDTTTKSAFKPNALSRPVEVNFSYYFDGDGDLNFN